MARIETLKTTKKGMMTHRMMTHRGISKILPFMMRSQILPNPKVIRSQVYLP
jgi:hypothetical protein